MEDMSASRLAFNLKVLRRHDGSIESIVETASFVVLYNYVGGEWTKTGVEGPLFLIRRSVTPYNGFFILNRNGVENFQASISPDDDLEITPEFIIYRPVEHSNPPTTASHTNNGDDDVYGIWIFEASQRMMVGEKMLKLQEMTLPPQPFVPVPENKASNDNTHDQTALQPSSHGVASVTHGDKANGASSKGKKQTTLKTKKLSNKNESMRSSSQSFSDAVEDEDEQTPKNSTNALSNPASLNNEVTKQNGTPINLDDLFAAGTSSDPSQQGSLPQKESASSDRGKKSEEDRNAQPEASLLDTLFQKAAISSDSTSVPAAPTSTAEQPITAQASQASQSRSASASTSPPPPSNQSQTLLSLLGVKGAAPAPSSSDLKLASSSNEQNKSDSAPSSNFNTIGSQKNANSQPDRTLPQDSDASATSPAAKAPKMSELLEEGIKTRIGLNEDGQPFSKRDFVREVLSMIHTNPEFVTELYDSYLARVK